MKKIFSIAIMLSLANATTISTLFEKLDNIPESKIDALTIKEIKATKKTVTYSNFPSLNIFASAEHFNDYISLKPLPPTESQKLILQKKSLPFSQNVIKIGFSLSMPIFIKEIYDNKKKISFLLKATKYQTLINKLNRQALLVTNLSKLNYLFSLKQALKTKENSIKTTKDAIEVGVKNGRIPEFQLLRLNDALNEIKAQINDLDTQIAKTKSDIYTLTLTKINKPIKFQSFNVNSGEFILIKPLKEKLIASKYDINAQKDKFLPKIMFKINANRAFAKAYNTGDLIAINSASAGIYINMELNRKNGAEIEKSKILYQKDYLQIKKTLKDLKAKIQYINDSLKSVKKEMLLIKESIAIKEELLKSAKKAYLLGVMSVDDYLKYEDDLYMQKAKLANLIAVKNSLLAQKAVIYGKNLKKVFK